MNTDTITLIYFSPTETTRRILDGIASGMGGLKTGRIDLTRPDSASASHDAVESGCAIIGIPVYAGRVPLPAAERLARLRAIGIPAILVAVYGNRAYEDALVELADISSECGFVTVACGAFIGEHSFSNGETPIAAGRPDERDMRSAADFGARVAEKIRAFHAAGELSPPAIPGNRPYKERRAMGGTSPRVILERCTSCGVCAAVCPSGAITIRGGVASDPGTCILCHACVKHCPEQAMVFDAAPVRTIAEWLVSTCTERKEPEWFL